jgi:hypothetical protein
MSFVVHDGSWQVSKFHRFDLMMLGYVGHGFGFLMLQDYDIVLLCVSVSWFLTI